MDFSDIHNKAWRKAARAKHIAISLPPLGIKSWDHFHMGEAMNSSLTSLMGCLKLKKQRVLKLGEPSGMQPKQIESLNYGLGTAQETKTSWVQNATREAPPRGP